MEPEEILNHITKRYPDTVVLSAWGEKAVFYNPKNKLKRGVYFATVKEKDGVHDKASNLNRPNVYRLSIGIPRDVYLQMFKRVPMRPHKGGVVETGNDFTSLDVFLPHPVYAWMGWITINNPSEGRLTEILMLMDKAIEKAKKSYKKRVSAGEVLVKSVSP